MDTKDISGANPISLYPENLKESVKTNTKRYQVCNQLVNLSRPRNKVIWLLIKKIE